MVSHYRELKVWQKAMDLVTQVYDMTATFPKEEIYGLTSQIRRSAVSVPSNIAEGASRDSTRDYLRFLSVAYGSLAELETQLLISRNLRFANTEKLAFLEEGIREIGRMLNGLQNSLKERLTTDHLPLTTAL